MKGDSGVSSYFRGRSFRDDFTLMISCELGQWIKIVALPVWQTEPPHQPAVQRAEPLAAYPDDVRVRDLSALGCIGENKLLSAGGAERVIER